jgi:hypothetical protein
MSKKVYDALKKAPEEQPKAIAVVHVVVANDTKYPDTAGPVLAFTKEEDANDYIKILNKRMVEIGTSNRTYEKQYLSIFNQKFKTPSTWQSTK